MNLYEISNEELEAEIIKLEKRRTLLQRLFFAKHQCDSLENGENPKPEVPRLRVMEIVLETVSQVFCLTLEELKSKARPERIAVPRMIAFYCILEINPSITFETIGHFFGKHHGTIMSGRKTVTDLMTVDGKFYTQVNDVLMRSQKQMLEESKLLPA